MTQQDFFNRQSGQVALQTIPTKDFFELYEIMEELADKKGRELGTSEPFTPQQYCLILQHCLNAVLLQDYPLDLDAGVAEHLEAIMADYDLIHLDEFIEEKRVFFPTGTRAVNLYELQGNMSFWKVKL